jgi:hypothetical protein
MNLGIDTTTTPVTTYFTANYPFPNSKCKVNFKCSDNTISDYIYAVSEDYSTSYEYSIPTYDNTLKY